MQPREAELLWLLIQTLVYLEQPKNTNTVFMIMKIIFDNSLITLQQKCTCPSTAECLLSASSTCSWSVCISCNRCKKVRKLLSRLKYYDYSCKGWELAKATTVEKPHFTDTHLIWTSHYYGQFALSLRKESPYKRFVLFWALQIPWLFMAFSMAFSCFPWP